MRRVTGTALVLICFMLTGCKADETLERARYSVVAATNWPVIIFMTNNNFGRPTFSINGMYRRSGWHNRRQGNTPARFGQEIEQDGEVRMDMLWYEVATENVYQAQITFDPTELKPDAITAGDGKLIIRIGSMGYIEAVTYEETYPPTLPPSEAIILDWKCGELTEITDPELQTALQRSLTEPLNNEGPRIIADIDDLPTRCGEETK